MDARALTLVVGGVEGLGEGLTATGQFRQVFTVSSTGGLRDLIRSGTLPEEKDALIFIFAEDLACDTPQTPLGLLLQKLTVADWKVIVVGAGGAAEALVAQNPGAGLLPTPVSVNLTLGAIAQISGAVLPPDPQGFDYLGEPAAAAPVAPPPVDVAPIPDRGPVPAGDGGAAFTPVVEPAEQPAGEGAPPIAWMPPAAETRVETGWASPEAAGWETPGPEPAAPATAAPAGPPTTPPGDSPFQASARPEPAGEADGGWGAPAVEQAGWTPPTDVQPVAPAAPAEGRRSLAEAAPAQAPPAWEGGSTDGFAAPSSWGAAPEPGPVMRPGSYQAEHALPTRRGWVVTVAVPKGGAGKTGMAINLGAYLGMRGRELGRTVCVVDSNLQQGDIAKYLKVYSPNILALAKDPAAISRDRIAQHLVHRPELNCSFLLAPPRPEDANPKIINARLYCQVLEVLRQLYDYVVIDTPVAEMYHDILRDFALAQADFIIVPVAPNYATLHNADAWLQAAVVAPRHINGAGIDPNRIGIVLNRAEPGIGCDEDDVRNELAAWLFLGSIPESPIWKLANNEGRIVIGDNYSPLNEVFGHILYGATGEEILLQQPPGGGDGATGGRLRGLFRRGRKR